MRPSSAAGFFLLAVLLLASLSAATPQITTQAIPNLLWIKNSSTDTTQIVDQVQLSDDVVVYAVGSEYGGVSSIFGIDVRTGATLWTRRPAGTFGYMESIASAAPDNTPLVLIAEQSFSGAATLTAVNAKGVNVASTTAPLATATKNLHWTLLRASTRLGMHNKAKKALRRRRPTATRSQKPTTHNSTNTFVVDPANNVYTVSVQETGGKFNILVSVFASASTSFWSKMPSGNSVYVAPLSGSLGVIVVAPDVGYGRVTVGGATVWFQPNANVYSFAASVQPASGLLENRDFAAIAVMQQESSESNLLGVSAASGTLLWNYSFGTGGEFSTAPAFNFPAQFTPCGSQIIAATYSGEWSTFSSFQGLFSKNGTTSPATYDPGWDGWTSSLTFADQFWFFGAYSAVSVNTPQFKTNIGSVSIPDLDPAEGGEGYFVDSPVIYSRRNNFIVGFGNMINAGRDGSTPSGYATFAFKLPTP